MQSTDRSRTAEPSSHTNHSSRLSSPHISHQENQLNKSGFLFNAKHIPGHNESPPHLKHALPPLPPSTPSTSHKTSSNKCKKICPTVPVRQSSLDRTRERGNSTDTSLTEKKGDRTPTNDDSSPVDMRVRDAGDTSYYITS